METSYFIRVLEKIKLIAQSVLNKAYNSKRAYRSYFSIDLRHLWLILKIVKKGFFFSLKGFWNDPCFEVEAFLNKIHCFSPRFLVFLSRLKTRLIEFSFLAPQLI